MRARIWLLLAGRRAEARMDEEFRFHVEMEIEKRVREGMDPAEARRQALIAFGGVERHKEMMRDERGGRWLADLLRDVRFAARAAAKDRWFTLTAALIIAIGVGATTAVFAAVNAVLLRPLPVPGAERLYAVIESRGGAVIQGLDGVAVPYARYVAYRDATANVFSGLAAHRPTSLSLNADGETTAVKGELTSGDYFAVLGIHPSLGRFFSSDDDQDVVLSSAIWHARFGGDPRVIGRTIRLDGRALAIVAVAPPGFEGTNPALRAGLWVPIAAARRGPDLESMGSWLFVFGRLRAGVSEVNAAGLVNAVAKRIPPGQPQTTIHGARLESMNGMFFGPFRGPVWSLSSILLGATLLVLLIACTNVGAMLSVRGVARRREISIRRAVGAGRGRVIRQLLAESVVLALIGGVCGVLVAEGSGGLVSAVFGSRFGIDVPLDVRPDLRVLAFALALTSITALLFGLVPALQSSGGDFLPALRDGGQAGARRASARDAFVAGQIALAVFLLVVAGLFMHSLRDTVDAGVGYDAAGLVVASTDLGPHGYDPSRGWTFYRTLEERVRALPGVQSVALGGDVLLGACSQASDMSNGRSGSGERREYGVCQMSVDTGFFSTLRMPIVAGRGFTSQDTRGGRRVVVVNETLAHQFWPGESAVGRYVRTNGHEMRVVGVVRDGRYAVGGGDPGGFAFLPSVQEYSGSMTLQVRLSPHARAAAVIRGIRREVRSLDPDVAVEDAGLVSVAVDRLLAPERALALLLAMFALVGIVLSGIGVYGTLSFQVAQRDREFGIRVALGAPGRAVVRSVVLRTAALGTLGAVVGVALSAGASYVLQRSLYGVKALDPVSFFAATAMLVTVSLIASFIPVRRAMCVDPAVVLRAD